MDDGVWESLVTGGDWCRYMGLVGGGLVSPAAVVVVAAAVTAATAVDDAAAAAVTVDRRGGLERLWVAGVHRGSSLGWVDRCALERGRGQLAGGGHAVVVVVV